MVADPFARSGCLDLAIINALGPNHWAQTALQEGSAAEAYDVFKRTRKDTEARCEQQGLRFWPVVMEHQGGMAKAADEAFSAIAKTVAMKETKEQAAIKREMLERLAVILARCTAQRIARRSTLANRRLWEPAVYRAAAAAAHLDVDWGDWQ